MKKSLTLILAALLAVTLLPVQSLAQEGGLDFAYQLEADGSATITGYTGSAEVVEIPAALSGAPVRAIGGAAFIARQEIKEVVIPEGVTWIGNAAFKNAMQLTRVSLPSTLIDLGESAFENCVALEALDIPYGIRVIKARTFQNCKALTSLTLPDGITSIGLASFSGLESLKELTLPKELRSIGSGAFAASHGLERLVIPALVEEIGYSAFHSCQNLKSVILPIGMKKLQGGMFYDCPSLEYVAFPSTIRTIDTSMLFTGSDKVSVWGFSRSAAQDIARELGVPFVEIAPVRGVELLDASGANVEGKTTGIDLASEDKTLQLSARLTQDSPWPLIQWSSSQPGIATVDQSGLVTGRSSGKATIIASATDGNGYSVSTEVNVAILVKDVSVTGESEIIAGKTTSLTAAVSPSNADDQTITWASSDEQAASITQKGLVRASKVDKVTQVEITATANDGSGKVGFLPLTIYPVAKEIALSVDGAALDAKSPIGIDFGSDKLTAQLTATVIPEDAKQLVSFKSNAPGVVSVTEDGLITAHRKGRANITVTAQDGTRVRGTWRVNVASLVKGIEIQGDDHMMAGGRLALKAVVTPEAADNKQVEWAVSDKDVASVSGGRVNAKRKIDQATELIVTATAKDGSGISASHSITVYPAASTVLIKAGEQALENNARLGIDVNAEDKTLQLTASVEPADALQGVTWKSSHPRFVTVDDNGLLTGVAKGESTITATASDGSNRRTSVKVKVAALATGLTLSSEKETLRPKERVRVTASFQPEDVDSKGLTWSSSDEGVATVDARGNVTARRNITEPQEVTITATTKDGSGISAEITLRVEP